MKGMKQFAADEAVIEARYQASRAREMARVRAEPRLHGEGPYAGLHRHERILEALESARMAEMEALNTARNAVQWKLHCEWIDAKWSRTATSGTQFEGLGF